MKKKYYSFDMIIYIMMIIAVIFAIVQSMIGNNNSLGYKIALGVWILIAVVLNDFVEPFINNKFKDITTYKLGQYSLYAILDAAAYACLYAFVINVGLTKEPIHYIFLGIGIVLFIFKTMALKAFDKKDKRAARFEEIYKFEEEEKERLRMEEFNLLMDEDEENNEVQTFKSKIKW